MIKLIIFITIVGLITLFIADKNIFKSIFNSFKKPKNQLHNDKDIKDNLLLAFEEVIYEIPFGCMFIMFLIIAIGGIIVLIDQI